MVIIFSILKIIILLGFLIFIHELGHFTVAKICKVKVNEFAIGFGPVLLRWQGKETKYQLRLIPIGGFVSMEGEDVSSNSARAFNKVKIPKRIAIVAAGGIINILFAIILYMSLQIYQGNNVSTEISSVKSGFVAEKIGLKSGDRIVEINGKKVYVENDVLRLVKNSNGDDLNILVKRDDHFFEVSVKPSKYEYYFSGMYFKSENDTVVSGFNQEKSIENQGVKIGDKIIAINDINVEDDTNKLIEALKSKDEYDKLIFKIKRQNEDIILNIVPFKEQTYSLGIDFKKVDNNFKNNFHYAVLKTGNFVFSVVDSFKMLLTGEVKVDSLSGPIGISKVTVKTKGLIEFLYIFALISLSLGATNLLPFPPLDGGKIVLLIIEAIIRKSLPEKLEFIIQLIGFAGIMLLSIYVNLNDVSKLFR